MRLVVFLLVVANLVFFAWTQGYLGGRDNPDAARLTQQLAADQLIVLSRDQPPGARPEPPAARPEPPAAEAPPPANDAADEATKKPIAEKISVEKISAEGKCLAWTALPAADADKLEAIVAGGYAGLQRTRHVTPETGSWWVFIPPLPSKADADRKASELKRFGAPEFYIVQDAGPNRYAISLGIFSSEQAANERLAALREKGVRSAKVGPRTGRNEQVAIEVNGPEAMVDAARQAVLKQFPDANPGACGRKG
jgi:hypothetical protein